MENHEAAALRWCRWPLRTSSTLRWTGLPWRSIDESTEMGKAGDGGIRRGGALPNHAVHRPGELAFARPPAGEPRALSSN